MNSSKTAASLHQCGARLGASFAGKAALVATLASETPALRRFQDHEPPPRSAYGMWRAWLANSSPKGFTHRSIGLFSPDDLVTAALAPLDKGPLERVRRTLSLQSPLTGDAFEEASGMLEQRVDWLNSLAAVLIGDSQPLETFMRILGNNLESWGLFGPAAAAQCSAAAAREAAREPNSSPGSARDWPGSSQGGPTHPTASCHYLPKSPS